MPADTVEHPIETKTELPNPVLPQGIEDSMKRFNDAMAAAKPAEPITEPEAKPAPKEEPKPEKPETPLEAAPAKKATLPQELISGEKSEPKIDEAISEIEAMALPATAKAESVASFAKLKEQSKKVIQEKLTRIAELESKTSDGSTKAEIEAAHNRAKAAEDKAKELESTIERLAFTESPKFKQFISEEMASLDGAKAYFEGTEVNPAIVDLAARTNGSQRIRVLKEAGADPELIAAVAPYLAQYDSIQRHKTASLENWKVESTQMAEAQKLQQETALNQRREAEDRIWNATMSRYENELIPYRKFEGNDPWNGRSDGLKSKAKLVFNGEGVSLETVADTIAKGVAYDALEEVRVALTEEIKKLATENAKLKAAKPTGGTTQGAAPGGNGEEKLSPTELAKKRFNEAMAVARGA